jgi:hypothetical protein
VESNIKMDFREKLEIRGGLNWSSDVRSFLFMFYLKTLSALENMWKEKVVD